MDEMKATTCYNMRGYTLIGFSESSRPRLNLERTVQAFEYARDPPTSIRFVCR